MPVAIKDVLCVEGEPTTCGSRMLAELPAAVRRHRDRPAQGGRRGPVRQDEHGRVRDGLVDREQRLRPDPQPLGRDAHPRRLVGRLGRGRRRRPRAARRSAPTPAARSASPPPLCGIVGLKPTYGRVSRYGLIAFASSLDQVGPFAHDLADAALLLEVIAGHDPLDSTSVDQPVPDYSATLDTPPESLRIGVVREFFGEGLDPEVEAAVREAVRVYEAAGATIKEVSLPALEVRRPRLLPRRPGRVLEQPRPLRRHDLRPPRRGFLAEVPGRGGPARR